MNNEKTGALIAELRKEKGLTQDQLGEQVFVSGKAVSKWERGLSFPSVDVLEKLAEVLGVTVTELTPEAAAAFRSAAQPCYDRFAREVSADLAAAFAG